jgi:TPR repeat protein
MASTRAEVACALSAVTAVLLVLLGAQVGGAEGMLQRAVEECARGGPSGCLTASNAYARGWFGAHVDRVRAELFLRRYLAALERACAAGEGSWCASLGGLYERGAHVLQDLGRARALYLRACALGYGAGCGAAERVGNAGP